MTHAPVSGPTASDGITSITSTPFEPKPLIAEILRTRYCAPGSVVLVEGVDVAYPFASSGDNSNNKSHRRKSRRRWRVVRLLLGDGELCIQALLAPEMHRYVDVGKVAFGSYIRLERFRVEWLGVGGADAGPGAVDVKGKGKGKGKETEKIPGAEKRGKVAYLVVEDLIVVGWNNTLIEMAEELGPKTGEDLVPNEEKEAQTPSSSPSPSPSPSLSPSRARAARRTTTTTVHQAGDSAPQTQQLVEEGAEAANSDSDFETMPISAQEKSTQNRALLNTNTSGSKTITNQLPAPHHHHPQRQQHRPWLATDPRQPVKLTPLRAIPHLPYKQNWAVNVLAVVSAVSPGVEPAGIPPYAQRQARLADPSTPKHVLLTVFLDAERFRPAVGSVVLLLGVKNHRFDGGSLKKYASDRPPAGAAGADGWRWWFENPEQFAWCADEVRALRAWWEERQLSGVQA
ncbi:hypothetical protein DL766_000801 [Monosporascus sp. MC13-8B]|uniref:Telomeric single stranded DNA binding POT1/Cdc13 domain-containing protein n=1 Tax=Monosporascus cannonballus TaxID=155416 RepID=A0ABY0HIR4_9PEZI|nr:hypothetical protein DL762_001110 [Monosporascus cannonballus]RYO98387.1 hypothetical protein DL763_002226 [Monosporascus cannonballus]RYP38801.1 hypothetical protein DL766_000801 [Monosporascus sp. MC13-8B]